MTRIFVYLVNHLVIKPEAFRIRQIYVNCRTLFNLTTLYFNIAVAEMGKYYEPKKTKSGYLICAVPSCQTKKSTTTLKTFEFPSDLNRRKQWISAVVNASK